MQTWIFGGLAVFSGLFLLTAAAAFWVAVHYDTRRRRMDLPLQRIGLAQAGEVRVRGRAIGALPLISPLTRTPCFYYWVEVQKWSKVKSSDWDWLTIHNDYGERAFHLEDDSGRILIDPRRAEFDLTPLLRAQVSPTGAGKIYFDAATAAHRPSARDCYAYLERHPPKKGEAVSWAAGAPEPAAADMRDDLLEAEAQPYWVFVPPGTAYRTLHLGCRFVERCVAAGHEYEVLATCVNDCAAGRLLAASKGSVFLITSNTAEVEKASLRTRAAVAFGIAIVFGAIGLGAAALVAFAY